MKINISPLILIGAVLSAVALGIFFPLNLSRYGVLGVSTSSNSTITLNANYFAEKEFYEGIINAEKLKSDYSNKKIKGGIIPHHLLPGYILTDFFKTLSSQNPKRIILIGPNHKEAGGSKPITSTANWKTQFGQLDSDYQNISDLINTNVLAENDSVTTDEHSIGGLLHYIKYYTPEAKIIPIIISSKTTPEEISTLAASLQNYIDEDTVVLASVDFSHYLSSTEAKEKDQISKKIIETFDYKNLYKLNNDYMDSPGSIGLLLNTMQNQDAKNIEILFNTNSGEILHDNTIQTTSYFSIVFNK